MLSMWASGKLRRKTRQRVLAELKARDLKPEKPREEKPETQSEHARTSSKGFPDQRHKVGCNS
jgi:hypothetical protein